MDNILDTIAASRRRALRVFFRPETIQEVFVLRLAAKLDDRQAVQHYIELRNQYSEDQLLLAYRRAKRHSTTSIARRFHDELKRLHGWEGNGHAPPTARIVALRVERRAVGVVILDGVHVEYTQTKQLSSILGKATVSAVNFVATVVGKFDDVSSAVVERVPNGGEPQRVAIQQEILRVLSEQAIGVAELEKRELLEALGFPPLRSREQLRELATSVWPALDDEPGGPWTHDAAMLGLHVQIERQFAIDW